MQVSDVKFKPSCSTKYVEFFQANKLFVCGNNGQYRMASPEEVLKRAKAVLSQRVRRGASMLSNSDLKDYLRLQLGELEYEVFTVLFLDVQMRLIEMKEMFRGTVTHASVYPREVVKMALSLNAVSVILAHNHPSGCVKPSRADELLTLELQRALRLVDVEVRDHLIVSHSDVMSFDELGWLDSGRRMP